MRDKITKSVMDQYEIVRSSGLTNMLDYVTVIEIAYSLGLEDLATLSRTDYSDLLENYSKYKELK